MMNSSERLFLVVPMGLEKIASYELHRFFSINNLELLDLSFFPGGIEFSVSAKNVFELTLSLNQFLRIPTRLLRRLMVFNAEDKETYEAQLKAGLEQEKIRREGWGVPKEKTQLSFSELQIQSRSSALNDDRKIKTWTNEVLSQFGDLRKGQRENLYIRFFRDECTLSIDTSNEALYKRGFHKKVGRAPLRENMSSALLNICFQGWSFESTVNLVDPFAGSGTILLEALLQGSALKKRKFATHIESSQNDALKSHMWPVHKAYGVEKDKATFDLLKSNFNQVSTKKYQLRHEDCLSVDVPRWVADNSPKNEHHPLFLVTNLPYGERIKKQLPFFKHIELVLNQYKPERAVFLIPQKWGDAKDIRGYELCRRVYFSNNGINVVAVLFIKSSK